MRVAIGQIEDLYHLPSVSVRVFPAGSGTVVVHAAVVIRKQKGTRRLGHYIVSILVDAEVFCNEFRRSHPEPPGQAFNIALVEYWACGLATVGAFQAVGSCKHFIVKPVYDSIKFAGVGFLEAVQELLVFLILACSHHSMPFQVTTCHFDTDDVAKLRRKRKKWLDPLQVKLELNIDLVLHADKAHHFPGWLETKVGKAYSTGTSEGQCIALS